MSEEYRLRPVDQPDAPGIRVTPYSLNSLAKQAHETASRKGFGMDEITAHAILAKLMLVVTEVAEAAEDVRAGNMTLDYEYKMKPGVFYPTVRNGHLGMEVVDETEPGVSQQMYPLTPELGARLNFEVKPIGLPSELADIIIRVLDLAAILGIDMDAAVIEKMEYNANREHRHGGKAA
jgi:hypothetical protein